MEMWIGLIILDVSFLFFWFLIHKARHSKNKTIRELDNGYEFYSSLNDEDKENYWKEDTHVVNCFFASMFVFIQVLLLTCVILPFQIIYVYLLIVLFIGSLVVFIKKSIHLKSKYKKQ